MLIDFLTRRTQNFCSKRQFFRKKGIGYTWLFFQFISTFDDNLNQSCRQFIKEEVAETDGGSKKCLKVEAQRSSGLQHIIIRSLDKSVRSIHFCQGCTVWRESEEGRCFGLDIGDPCLLPSHKNSFSSNTPIIGPRWKCEIIGLASKQCCMSRLNDWCEKSGGGASSDVSAGLLFFSLAGLAGPH